MSFDKVLERTVNVLVITICLTVGYRYANGLIHTAKSSPLHSDEYNGRSIASIRPQKDSGGVLLFLSSTCPYCERSLPFYRDLGARLQARKMTLLVTLADGESPIAASNARMTGKQYIHSRGLVDASPIDHSVLAAWPVRGTPTLLTYGSDGKITGLRRGLLNPAREKDVLAALELK